MSLENLIKDIEGDVQNPPEGSTTPDNEVVEATTQEFALEGFNELSDFLPTLTLMEHRLNLKVSVESQEALDKKIALEFFAMIPDLDANVSRLTEARSAYNRSSVLGLLTPYSREDYTRQSDEFLKELMPVLFQMQKKVKEHAVFACFFVERIEELRKKHSEIDPRVVYRGKQMSLWSDNWVALRSFNDYDLDYEPYKGKLSDKIHCIVTHPHFDFVMKDCASNSSPSRASETTEACARSIVFGSEYIDKRIEEIRKVRESVNASKYEVGAAANNALDYVSGLVSAVRLFENGDTSFPAMLLDYLSFLD